MSVTGKTSTYIKKMDVKESLVPNVGFKRTRFLHQATSGDTLIQLSSLTTPTSAVNYSAPNVSELTATNLMQWTQNFTLTSSLRGVLIQNVSYVISGSSTIKLLYSASDGEIFEGIIDHNARTGLTMVDAAPIVVSGTLTAGSTDFNVGTPFPVGKYPSAKRGVLQVEIDGQPAYRTDGNAAFGTGISGDYYEVHSGSGLGQILRFQPDLVNDRFIMVTSVGPLVEKPNGSVMAAVETVQGQIDALVPTVAELAGVAETNFQSAPNNTDLKSFGDRVITLEKILDLSIPIQTNWVNAGPMTITGVSSNPTKPSTSIDLVRYRQEGSDWLVEYELRMSGAGTNGSGEYIFQLPSGVVLDTTKVNIMVNPLGTGTGMDDQQGLIGYGHITNGASRGMAYCFADSSTSFRVLTADTFAAYNVLGSGFYNFGSAQSFKFILRFPGQGLTATQTIRQALGL